MAAAIVGGVSSAADPAGAAGPAVGARARINPFVISETPSLVRPTDVTLKLRDGGPRLLPMATPPRLVPAGMPVPSPTPAPGAVRIDPVVSSVQTNPHTLTDSGDAIEPVPVASGPRTITLSDSVPATDADVDVTAPATFSLSDRGPAGRTETETETVTETVAAGSGVSLSLDDAVDGDPPESESDDRRSAGGVYRFAPEPASTVEAGGLPEPVAVEATIVRGKRGLSIGDFVSGTNVDETEAAPPEEAVIDEVAHAMADRRYRNPVDVTAVPLHVAAPIASRPIDAPAPPRTQPVVAAAASELADWLAGVLSDEDGRVEIGGSTEDDSIADATDPGAGNTDLEADDSEPDSVVVADPPPAPRRPKRLVLPEGTPVVPLQLDFAQVRSLTIGGRLRDVKVVDPMICQAVQTGDNQIKLIGTSNGVTQLVVWAEPPSGQATFQAFEINVDDHRMAAAADTSLLTLDETIQRSFPDCEVYLEHRGDSVRVTGRCPNNGRAKKIMRMIRRTCLMPVTDNLSVSR